jgi:hypothetical protein
LILNRNAATLKISQFSSSFFCLHAGAVLFSFSLPQICPTYKVEGKVEGTAYGFGLEEAHAS